MNRARHLRIRSEAAVLERSRADLFRNIVDAGIVIIPVFEMACLAYGQNKAAAVLGSAVVLSAFLHNHFLYAARATYSNEYQPTRRSMQIAAENLRNKTFER